jgi:uncharacterized SAM-dependent methyltransferase
MHLVSRRRQVIDIRALNLQIPFEPDETIHTESSYRFDLPQLGQLAGATGFEPRSHQLDPLGRFASSLLIAV